MHFIYDTSISNVDMSISSKKTRNIGIFADGEMLRSPIDGMATMTAERDFKKL